MFNLFTKAQENICKILIIEDNAETQETLKSILQTQDAEISIAATGEAAEDLLKTGYEPHIILLDLNLPRMTGGQFMEKTMHIPNAVHVPIITFSSTWDEKLNQPYEKDVRVVEEYLNVRQVKERAGNLKVSDIIPKYKGQENVNIVHPQLILLTAKELLHQGFELTPSFQHLIYISQKQMERLGGESKPN